MVILRMIRTHKFVRFVRLEPQIEPDRQATAMKAMTIEYAQYFGFKVI